MGLFLILPVPLALAVEGSLSSGAVDWTVVTLVLSISGFAGGTAFHLVKNEGSIEFPKAQVQDSNKVRMGIIADIIIGIVAANAIHVAISGVVRYDIADTKFYTTFIALGVLAGFGGATLLKALSEKLHETVTKNEFEGLQAQVAEEAKRRDILESGRLERVVEDALLFRRQPRSGDTALLEVKSEEIAAKPDAEQSAADMLILAYKAHEEENWSEAIELVEKAMKKGLPVGWQWAAHNLLGLSYHYADSKFPDWFERAKEQYKKALEALSGSDQPISAVRNQLAVTKTNLAYACLDAGEAEECVRKAEEVLELEPYFTGTVPVIIEVARLGLVCGKIRQNQTEAAAQILERNGDPEAVRYLFENGSIPTDVLKVMQGMDKLPSGFAYIKKLA